jgi:hypothetical protein
MIYLQPADEDGNPVGPGGVFLRPERSGYVYVEHLWVTLSPEEMPDVIWTDADGRAQVKD